MVDYNAFLNSHPEIEHLELVLVDPNGMMRGKWAPITTLKKALSDGVNFPLSLHGLDVWGNEVEKTNLHISSGDPDGFCLAVPHSLSPVPWTGEIDQTGQTAATVKQRQNATHAQVILQTKTQSYAPFGGCARSVLQQCVERLAERSLTAVCAFELEFHLLKPQSQWQDGMPVVAGHSETPDAQHMYQLNALAEHSALFADIRRAAKWADLPIDTIVKEAGAGQYELNLNHRNDPLRAADDVILLKRIICETARHHGLMATFMAKPFLDSPGNGMHVHMSLLDGEGVNIFSSDEGTTRLHHALTKLLKTMPEMTMIFANTHNGFRRMAPGSYAPTRANWGENNRSVALRLPAAPDHAKRLEHRVSGADANPYLVLATLLQGVIDGLDEAILPPPPLEGNAYEESTAHRGPALPHSLALALQEFTQSDFAKKALGQEMHAILCALKQAEIDVFANDMSALEQRSFL